MNVVELLDEACARRPSEVALMWGLPAHGRTLSFGALQERSRRLATLLRRRGLRPGDAVAIAVPLSGPLYEVMAGVLRAGLIPVFVDPALWRQTLAEAAARLPLRGFVGTPLACALRWFVPALRRIPHAFTSGAAFPGATSLRAAAQCPATVGVEPRADGDTALLTFTSGSTGRPKGVLRAHGMLRATHGILSTQLALAPGTIGLSTLPFIVFDNLAAGVGSVIPDFDLRRPTQVDPETLVAQLREWKASSLVTTPFLAGRIVEHCRARAVTLDALRDVHTGGAPVLPELLEQLAAIAPRARIGAVYGATEAEPIAIAALSEFGPEVREAIGAGGGVLVGRPAQGVSVRILRDAWGSARGPYTRATFERETLPAGTRGEIVVSGDHVSPGYLGGVGDAEHKIAVDGCLWHRTGDAGYFDAAGRLWLAGRCATRIVRDEKSHYALQAEAAFAGVAGVARGTLLQMSNGRVVLVVQPAGRPEAVDVDMLLTRLDWCRPDEVVMLSAIPMDRRHHAKVSYGDVQRLLERGAWLSRRVVTLA